jgi:hypothetical protein
MRAAVTTPVESPDAYLARFSNDCGLPRYYGESASTASDFGACSTFTRVTARMDHWLP